MKRVRVDFNSRGPKGYVRGSQRRADDGHLEFGEHVELYDPHEEDMRFEAVVAQLDETTGVALFDVAWEPATQVLPAGAVVNRISPNLPGNVIPMAPRVFKTQAPLAGQRVAL